MGAAGKKMMTYRGTQASWQSESVYSSGRCPVSSLGPGSSADLNSVPETLHKGKWNLKKKVNVIQPFDKTYSEQKVLVCVCVTLWSLKIRTPFGKGKFLTSQKSGQIKE